MRAVFSLFTAFLLLVGCGKNQVTVEVKGGDGQLVRLDANDLQYKFNHLVKADTYVFPSPDSDIELRSDGGLADIAPTVLQLLNIPVPEAMSGKSLVASTATLGGRTLA